MNTPVPPRTLMTQRRVFQQPDWYALEELDAHAVYADDGRAGLCAAPISDGAVSAWLRWAALADGVSATAALRGLFEQTLARLRTAGCRELWCVCDRHNWLRAYLADHGFAARDQIVTLERRLSPGVGVPDLATLAGPEDLAAIAAIDAASFPLPWSYPPAVLRRALRLSDVFIVARRTGLVAGYLCASLDGTHAHIIRVAVRPDMRRDGLGRGLLDDALARLATMGADVVTLNTPVSYQVRGFYERAGFRLLPDVADVVCREI